MLTWYVYIFNNFLIPKIIYYFFYYFFAVSLMYAFAEKYVIQEKIILQTIGTALNNAIDWDGHGFKRQRVPVDVQ